MLTGETVAAYRVAQSPNLNRLVIAPPKDDRDPYRLKAGSLRIYEKDAQGFLLVKSIDLPLHGDYRWKDWIVSDRYVLAFIHYPHHDLGDWWWLRAPDYSTLILDAQTGTLYQVHHSLRGGFVVLRPIERTPRSAE